MRELIIIGSYADSNIKLELLEKCIIGCKHKGLDVLVYAKYPIPERIHKLCDYYIFDKSNPIVKNRVFSVWRIWSNRKIVFNKEEYGFAAIEQIINGLGFAHMLNYEYAHFLNYDIDLTNFDEYYKKMKSLIPNSAGVFYNFGKYGDNLGVLCTQMYFNVQKSFTSIKPLINLNHYQMVTSHTEKLAEAFLYHCLLISNLKIIIIKEPPILNELFTEQGDRLYGLIPKNHKSLLKYFECFYIGSAKDTSSIKKIMVYKIKQEISYLKLDIGTEILEFTDLKLNVLKHYQFYEIDLIDTNPIKLTILQVNNEIMQETIDETLSNRYWKSNFIFEHIE
jgi:hypothetical protein